MSIDTSFQVSAMGMQRGMQMAQQNAQKIASGGVDTEALVGMKLAVNQVEAAAKALQYSDEMVGTLINETV